MARQAVVAVVFLFVQCILASILLTLLVIVMAIVIVPSRVVISPMKVPAVIIPVDPAHAALFQKLIAGID